MDSSDLTPTHSLHDLHKQTLEEQRAAVGLAKAIFYCQTQISHDNIRYFVQKPDNNPMDEGLKQYMVNLEATQRRDHADKDIIDQC